MQAHRPAWIYDRSPIPDPMGYGKRAVTFCESLKHPKSTEPDQAFKLSMFWKRIIRRVYGTVDRDGRRQIKVVFCLLPRGSRKTSVGASLALLHTAGFERITGGQVIAAASSEDQARLGFEEADAMQKATPWLAPHVRVTDSSNLIEHPKSGSAFQAVSSEGSAQLGRTPYFVLADELCVWKNRELWKALRTGLPKTPNSLLWITTQAGRASENLAHPLYEYALKVESGAVRNTGFLPVIFRADPDCDWKDEKIWHYVNPGLAHGFPDLAGLRQLAREAEERPADRDDFLQFHLNIWQSQSTSPFLDMATYDRGAATIDMDSLKGLPCWLAVDCSSTTDLSALVAVWRDGEKYIARAWFYVPQEGLEIRSKRDKVDYERWAREGWIVPTPGSAIDYRMIETQIRSLCADHLVREIGFDRAYGQAVMGPLLDEGFPVVVIQQGWITQSPALNQVERLVISGLLQHDSPVLRWCFSNVAIHRDSAGNRTMHKGKSRERIDGATAAWMAISRAVADEGEKSIYDCAEFWEDAPKAEGVEGVDDGSWKPEILNDPTHPDHAEHKRRFEEWQDSQPDDDY